MHVWGGNQTHVPRAAAPGVPAVADATVDPGGGISPRSSGSLPGKPSWQGRGAIPENRAPARTGAMDRQRIPRRARTDTAFAALAPTVDALAARSNKGRRTASGEDTASVAASAAPQDAASVVATPAQNRRRPPARVATGRRASSAPPRSGYAASR